jgi:hypothetical protein
MRSTASITTCLMAILPPEASKVFEIAMSIFMVGFSSMRRHGGWLRKHYAAQQGSEESAAHEHGKPPMNVSPRARYDPFRSPINHFTSSKSPGSHVPSNASFSGP